MIQRLWQGNNKLYYCLLPLAWCYGCVIAIRKKLYQSGYFKSWKAPIPVVVVGNLTVGGTGKTPFVIWLTQQLTAQGLKVGIVSRGYKGKSDVYPLLVTQQSLSRVVGDEPVLIYQATGVPLAVAPSRVAACQYLLSHFSLDIIVTDDGLQHYALRRDYEIVIVDHLRQFGNQQLLPAGPLRERLERLKQVDLIVQNGGENQDYIMRLEGTHIVNLKNNEKRPIEQVNQCYALAGIGCPERFFHTLESYNIKILQQKAFVDHHHYRLTDITSVFPTDEIPVIMTEKDAVKCGEFAKENWWYLPVEAVFEASQQRALLNQLMTKLSLPQQNREALCR